MYTCSLFKTFIVPYLYMDCHSFSSHKIAYFKCFNVRNDIFLYAVLIFFFLNWACFLNSRPCSRKANNITIYQALLSFKTSHFPTENYIDYYSILLSNSKSSTSLSKFFIMPPHMTVRKTEEKIEGSIIVHQSQEGVV